MTQTCTDRITLETCFGRGVHMKKYALAAAFALSTLGMGSASSAAVISSGNILMNGDTLDLGGLSDGVQYFLTVGGTGTIADGRLADAEFYQRNGNAASWFTARPPGLGGEEIGVSVYGFDVDFGPFSPSHTYTVIFTAVGNSVSLLFRDIEGGYGDNAGFLTASVSAVPLPASALGLLAGLAGLGLLRRRKTA